MAIIVIDPLDIDTELCAQIPADQGHERLKKAKGNCNGQGFLYVETAHAGSLANSRGARVHRQSDCQYNQFQSSQAIVPPT